MTTWARRRGENWHRLAEGADVDADALCGAEGPWSGVTTLPPTSTIARCAPCARVAAMTVPAVEMSRLVHAPGVKR